MNLGYAVTMVYFPLLLNFAPCHFNWVGGKRYISVYLLLHVYRPPTPPYKRVRIRRFRALTPYGVWQVVFSHPIGKHHSWLSSDSVLLYAKESLFGHLTTKEPTGSSHLLLHCTILSFPVATRDLGTMTSADFSRQALLRDF